ncbi:MAG: hypothetical protein Fur0028_16380 [Bacteroidales bacterium]
MKINKRNSNIIFNICVNHVIKKAKKERFRGVDKKLIYGYLTGKSPVNSLNVLFDRFLSVLQNTNMKPKVIKYNLGLKKKFLLGYDHINILNKYKSAESLFRAAKRENPSLKKGRIWLDFCQGVLDVAFWMQQFKNIDSFLKYIRPFEERGLDGIDMLVQSLADGRIKGLGPALSYNFIMELGLPISDKISKPDTHIIKTLAGLGLCKNNVRTFDAVRIVSELAEASGKTTFAFDKVIWLANSGYLHNDFDERIWTESQTTENRLELLKEIKRKLRG